MCDEAALLRAICAEPDDDLPRLVYADWLEEHGRPERAELIRVQCRLAGAAGHEAPFWDLIGRQGELLPAAGAAPALPGAYFGPPRRGFPCHIAVTDWAAFAPHLDAALDAVPGAALSLVGTAAAAVGELAGRPAAERLTALSLFRVPVNRDVRGVLGEAGRLAGLRSLSIEGGVSRAGALAKALAGRRSLPRLRSLTIRHAGMRSDEAARLAAADHRPGLERLDLSGNQIDGNFFGRAARSPGLRRLRSLRLCGNPLSGRALWGLPQGRDISRVASLRLANCGLTDLGLSAVAQSAFFANLTELDIGGNRLSGDVFAVLAVAPFWRGLRRLRVGGNRLPADYAGAPAVPPLESLDAADAGLGDAGAASLVGWLGGAALHTLRLDGNAVGNRAAAALAAPDWAGLRRLGLRRCGLIDLAVPAGLVELDLSDNRVRAVSDLAAAELRSLHLAGNPVADAAAWELAASPHLRRLQRLTLDRRYSAGTAAALEGRFGNAVRWRNRPPGS